MNNVHISRFNDRQTMRSLDFEIYHYYDASPCNVALHHHDFFEIYYLIAGSMDYIVEGNRFALSPGDVLLISPLDLHHPEAERYQSFERIVLWISMPYLTALAQSVPGLLPTLLMHSSTGRQLTLSDQERSFLDLLLSSLLDERANHPHASREMCRLLITAALIRIQRQLIASPRDSALISGSVRGVRRASGTPVLPAPLYDIFDYIDTHLEESLTLSSLADQFFLDANTLSRKFKQQMGITVCDYIRKKRLALARVKISQGMSATQAGATSGFSDYSSFFRAFKSEYGISPREFATSYK